MISRALLLLTLIPGSAYAHGGGLDSRGCHTNRKTGEYHCHGGAAAPAPRAAATLSGARAVRSDVQYANCTEARAAGAAPVRRGDPGYSPKLDRDGDGIGCE